MVKATLSDVLPLLLGIFIALSVACVSHMKVRGVVLDVEGGNITYREDSGDIRHIYLLNAPDFGQVVAVGTRVELSYYSYGGSSQFDSIRILAAEK